MNETTDQGERHQESWSALMDDEVDDLEMRRMLQDADDPDVRARWMRYQVARAAIRGEVPDAGYVDLSARVSAALADEPHPEAAAGRRLPGYARPLGSVAIAASVAALVVFGARFLDSPETLQEPARDTLAVMEAPAEPRAEPIIRQGDGEAPAAVVARRQPAEGSRMFIRTAHGSGVSDHQLRHTAHAGGMLPYARVFSLESDPE